MKSILPLLMLLLSSCILSLSAQTIIGQLDPQDSLQRHEVLTEQGDRIQGHIFQMDENLILLQLPDGRKLSLLRSKIKSIRVLGEDEPIEAEQAGNQILVTTRGERFVGRVQRMENDTVFFLFQGKNLLRFPMSRVDYISKASEEERLTSPTEDYPTPTDILLSPTGFGLEEGESQYRNVMAFYNSVNHGLTNHFSLGGGILPFIGDGAFFLFNLNGKLSTELAPSIHFAGGLNIWVTTGDGTTLTVIPNVALSVGSRHTFLNLSYGRAFFDGEDLNTIGLGSMVRLAPNWQLYLDNQLVIYEGDEVFEDGILMIMPGASWTKNRNRLNFGMWVGISSGEAFGFPTASYLRRF